MANRKVVGLVNGVLIVAVLIPILLSIYLAHRKAEQAFHDELSQFASRAIIRSDRVIKQATRAIDEINQLSDGSCSYAHRQAMRRVGLNHRYVQEILFQRDGHILCSSLEEFSRGVNIGRPDRTGKEGYSAWYSSTTELGFKRSMIYIGKASHIAAIDPLSFIDVIPVSGHLINIAMIGLNSGLTIATNSPQNGDAWKDPLANGVNEFQYQGSAYVIRRENNLGLAMIAWAPLAPLNKVWYQQLLIWLPIGIGASLAAGFYITRLLRRLQSPRSRLADAIKNDDFTVMYQPIVDLQSGKSVGAEILLRWAQPDGTYLSPDIFVPLAEETGLITPITEQVIGKLFTELGDWLHKHPDQHISINLAPRDVRNLHILNVIRPWLVRYFIKPEQIAFEITERGFADPKITAPVIERFRKAGHPVYIDDFGTGYSSLSYLHNLHVDVLKIDKSFVEALEYKKVTPYIIKMAKTLNIAMVAEGVETAGQAAWLRKHGVQYGQGWLYSKALPKQELIEWIARNNAQR
ncbi:EAL domain-containing protein [Enterobacteriaceae bacterium H18W14]|uniref:EAL domain-containing protein n=1 Tax=Dryocola boscaweniae TaxID=2925397 RepID=UPI0022F0E716|nr:EAL domain-containing protein [Dryocola boscaweniae]MCT4713765.1 EAL domain-containing protein [Dryocola boscaweniae]